MAITLLVRVKGGAGSGNYGHAGRPGMVGGSGGSGGAAIINHRQVIDDYKVWSPDGGSPTNTQLDRMFETCVRSVDDVAQRFKRKGVATHQKLRSMYKKGGFRDTAVQGALVLPKRGPFKGIPLTVRGTDKIVIGKGAVSWTVSPLFSSGGGKGKTAGWSIGIPKEDL